MNEIAFALLSNSQNPLPSTRIACLRLFPYLLQKGFNPTIVFDPVEPCEEPDVGNLFERTLASKAKILVVQKIHGPSVLRAVSRLKSAGVRTIYCVCDLVDNEMAAATDATIVVTHFLKSLYHPDLQSRIYVVHDGIERPELVRSMSQLVDSRFSKRGLRAALVTSDEVYRIPVFGVPPKGWCVDVIGRFPQHSQHFQQLQATRWALAKLPGLLEKLGLLRAILHPDIRHLAWSAEGVYKYLCESDIGIIPVDTSVTAGPSTTPPWKMKSENRLTLKMALGLPVIATPIPSYEEVIRHGENGFFARSRDDWMDCFDRLRDFDLRREMGAKARNSVLERYSREAQANLFTEVLRRVFNAEDRLKPDAGGDL